MSADEPTVPGLSRHRLSPKKLLLSKWTAVTPRDREKHFLVVRVVPRVPPAVAIDVVELEAIHSKRSLLLPWRALTDKSRWRQGWT